MCDKTLMPSREEFVERSLTDKMLGWFGLILAKQVKDIKALEARVTAIETGGCAWRLPDEFVEDPLNQPKFDPNAYEQH